MPAGGSFGRTSFLLFRSFGIRDKWGGACRSPFNPRFILFTDDHPNQRWKVMLILHVLSILRTPRLIDTSPCLTLRPASNPSFAARTPHRSRAANLLRNRAFRSRHLRPPVPTYFQLFAGSELGALFATGIKIRSVDQSSSYQEQFNNLILKKLLPALHIALHKSPRGYPSRPKTVLHARNQVEALRRYRSGGYGRNCSRLQMDI